ncbi:tRNA splicing endonuclease 54, variant 2 [Entomophthora muscae]|uniref:tRNA splicing endonuclease 54, variant 2 n=1 Tax=Entomophthora muscae TaxID=34485 RepID=A0ACC2SQG2_9FUNG|nr:tRNA splicing endonuclease 54, variant 2 [Entomophthora muscae]
MCTLDQELQPVQYKIKSSSWVVNLFRNFSSSKGSPSLVVASKCQTHDDIFQLLQVISERKNTCNRSYLAAGRYRPKYMIWRPSSSFRRKSPGVPYKLVTIVNMSDAPPSHEDFSGLSSKSLTAPVTVAMVDSDNITFLDPSFVAFS